MARYIDAVECAEKISESFGIPLFDLVDVFAEIPTADVAPRADIARGIFDEIEKIILDNTYPDFNREHKPVNIWKATTGYDAFYELKKKYTEGNKEN